MIESVQHKSTFLAFRSAGVRVRSGPIQMIFTVDDSSSTTVQLAFALSRKFGNAVQRNRARRRMREGFRQLCSSSPKLPAGGAFLLLADPTVNECSYDELISAIGACFSSLQAKGAF